MGDGLERDVIVGKSTIWNRAMTPPARTVRGASGMNNLALTDFARCLF